FEHILDAATNDPAKVVLALADMVKADPPLTNAFVAEFASRLHGQGPAMSFPMTWLEQRFAEQGQTVDNIFQQASQNQAADQVSIGNSIGSLRFLAATEWRDFVESMSVVERTLRTDPAGVYPAMDFATRDRYRHVVEEIAKRSTLSEEEVTGKAVELAEAAGGDGNANGTAHVGYFLVDRGRRALERAARGRPTPSTVMQRVAGHVPMFAFTGSIVLLTALATALGTWWGARHGLNTAALIVSGSAMVVCASQLAVAIVHWATTFFVQPRILARMDFSKGIPPEHRTVEAVPTMLTDDRETDELLDAMEVRFLANRDENLSFALVTDFRDAPQEHMPGDEARLEHARECIDAIHAK